MKSFPYKYGIMLAGVLLLLALGACEDPGFDAFNQITDLRILAITTDPTEASPGDEVTFTALVANKDGSPYDGYLVWIVSGGAGTNFEGLDPDNPDLDNIDPGSIGFQEPGGDPFVYTVPQPDDIRKYYGYYSPEGTIFQVVLVVYKGVDSLEDILEGKGKSKIAYKTMIVSERPESERNENPVFTGAEVSQAGQVLEPDEYGFYRPSVNGGNIRMNVLFDNATSGRTSYSWYIVEGGFENVFGPVNDFPGGFHAGFNYVYVVCRDNYLFESGDDFSIRSSGIGFATLKFQLLEDGTPQPQ